MALIYDLCEELANNASYCEAMLNIKKLEDTSFAHLAGLRYKDGNSTLVVNPDLLKNLSKEDQLTILEHELLHFINCHHERRVGRDLNTWNLACDCAVNSLIKVSENLKEILITPQFFDLPEKKSAEWYYESLLLKGVRLEIKNHESWSVVGFKKTESTINWKHLLSRYLKHFLMGQKVSSKKRVSRRLGTKPGKKRFRGAPSLLIALDVSVSASEYVDSFWNQVKIISEETKVPVTVVEFSDVINSLKDISQVATLQTRISDETNLNPVLKLAQKFSCSIIFTDSMNSDSQLVKCVKPIIWVYPAGVAKLNYKGKHIWLD